MIVRLRLPIALFLIGCLFILTLASVSCQSVPLLSKVSLLRDTISPNGDNIDDFTAINYTSPVRQNSLSPLSTPKGSNILSAAKRLAPRENTAQNCTEIMLLMHRRLIDG